MATCEIYLRVWHGFISPFVVFSTGDVDATRVESGVAAVQAMLASSEAASALRPETRVLIQRPDGPRSELHWEYQACIPATACIAMLAAII